MKGTAQMAIMIRLTALVVATVAALALTACGSDDEPTPRPEGAITVQQNVPTPVDGGTVIAYNLTADSAWMSLSTPGTEATKQQVHVGDTVTVGSVDYTVHAITEPGDDSAAPGAGSGTVVLAPAG